MGQRGAVGAGDYNFSMVNENNNINWEKVFLYTTELYQLLRENSLLGTGCHI